VLWQSAHKWQLKEDCWRKWLEKAFCCISLLFEWPAGYRRSSELYLCADSEMTAAAPSGGCLNNSLWIFIVIY